MGTTVSKTVKMTKSQQISYFSGKWYEIARIDSWFESGCKNSIAYYRFSEDKISIVNTCDRNGTVSRIEGYAYPVDPKTDNASFYVRFPFSFRNQYNIVYYKKGIAFVTNDNFSYFWVLSRKRKISNDKIDVTIKKIKEYPIDHDKLIWN